MRSATETIGRHYAVDAAEAHCDLESPRNFPEGDAMEAAQDSQDEVDGPGWQEQSGGLMGSATDRSQAHMRRMADLLTKFMKERQVVADFDYSVDDGWMVADCNNIVVHLMRSGLGTGR
ncbi:hypothetical protein PRNP1_014789 [Phytophthora ramorum]